MSLLFHQLNQGFLDGELQRPGVTFPLAGTAFVQFGFLEDRTEWNHCTSKPGWRY
jgi:hypothetical protein